MQSKDWFSNPLPTLLLIVGLYLLLAVAYSVVVPIGRGADEWAHFWYAQFIADNGRLPANSAERKTAGYKSDWPPLYHFFAAALTAPIETEGPPSFKYRTDSIRRQLVPAHGPEAILHTEDEQSPWQQEILVWHLGRFLSIAFSVGTLLITYSIALNLFTTIKAPDYLQFAIFDLRLAPASLALMSTAVLAFNPRFIFTGMLFNYDSLTLFLSALFLWVALRILNGRYSRWGFLGLGALAGLALVTKYLAALLPLVIIFVAWVRSKEQGVGSRGAGTQGRTRSVLGNFSFWKNIAQAVVAYLLVSGWWFVYLVVTFNETDKYGPVLGTLAPLIRGDGSDRTVETLFAWLSGGQALPPAFIETKSYTAWQIFASFWQTFWGNPVIRPYPLNWFILLMAVASLLSIIGLIIYIRLTSRNLGLSFSQFILHNSSLILLFLTCLLPLPFMLARLFGARDALEAVQGRHILFLAGPAVAVLFVLGLTVISLPLVERVPRIRNAQYAVRITYYVFCLILLIGSVSQLVVMWRNYPPLLPVQTTAYAAEDTASVPLISLPGGATLLDYQVEQLEHSLQVSFVWQGGSDFAPEDYQLELQLVGEIGPVSAWSGVQTQARYPTRVWEAGDVVRDVGWLPMDNIAAGDYAVQWRILSNDSSLFDWQTLVPFTLYQMTGLPKNDITVWQDGQPATQIPDFTERETIPITIRNRNMPTDNLALVAPDGSTVEPVATGFGWANFIVQPHWPSGDYNIRGEISTSEPVVRIEPGRRNFAVPAEMTHSLNVDFEGMVKLLGYRLPSRSAEAGSGLPITLYWQGQQWMGEEFVIFTRLLDNQSFVRGGYDRLAKENYSTLLWAPGEVVTDGFAVPVNADAPDGVYTLNVGWYRDVDGEASSLEIINPETGKPTGETSVTIGPVKVGGPPAGVTIENPTPQVFVNQSLGDKINLLGYNLSMVSGEQSAVNLTVYWQAMASPAVDYTVFVHIRDSAGQVVAQKDGPPVGGAYPTSLWGTGEIIKDKLTISLAELPSGKYEAVIGMYDFNTGARLPVEGSADETVVLETIEVAEE